MIKKYLATICLITFCNTVVATGNSEIVDQIMRGIGIKYLISTDRKLPKRDRKKWEESLSSYVDFDSLNKGMMERIRKSLSKLNEEKIKISLEDKAIFEKTLASLGKKAVLFFVPKELSSYMLAYLSKKDALGMIKKCMISQKPKKKEELILCINDVSESEIHVNFIMNAPKIEASLVFKKTNKWLLSNIEGPISKKRLELIAIWK